MFWCLLGCAGFVLFFLYDVLQTLTPFRGSGALFFLGLALLLAGTGGLIARSLQAGPSVAAPRALAALLLAGVFLFLLLHSLFFSLPRETYHKAPGHALRLVDTGLYALCRHPGVLFFCGLYAALWLAFGGKLLLLAALCYSLLNLLYGLMQDRWSFPRQFAGYHEYRARTPFLIPNRKSLRACLRSWGRAGEAASQLP